MATFGQKKNTKIFQRQKLAPDRLAHRLIKTYFEQEYFNLWS